MGVIQVTEEGCSARRDAAGVAGCGSTKAACDTRNGSDLSSRSSPFCRAALEACCGRRPTSTWFAWADEQPVRFEKSPQHQAVSQSSTAGAHRRVVKYVHELPAGGSTPAGVGHGKVARALPAHCP